MEGTLTCPECEHEQKMEIPEKICVHFYECEGCKKIIKAEESCCVFCDYADQECPVSCKE